MSVLWATFVYENASFHIFQHHVFYSMHVLCLFQRAVTVCDLWSPATALSGRSEIPRAPGHVTHRHQLALSFALSGGDRWPQMEGLSDSLDSQSSHGNMSDDNPYSTAILVFYILSTNT